MPTQPASRQALVCWPNGGHVCSGCRLCKNTTGRFWRAISIQICGLAAQQPFAQFELAGRYWQIVAPKFVRSTYTASVESSPLNPDQLADI